MHSELPSHSSLSRLRQELFRLFVNQSEKAGDAKNNAVYRSARFENILDLLSRSGTTHTHPKAQAELAFWRGKEEEARRRLTTARP